MQYCMFLPKTAILLQYVCAILLKRAVSIDTVSIPEVSMRRPGPAPRLSSSFLDSSGSGLIIYSHKASALASRVPYCRHVNANACSCQCRACNRFRAHCIRLHVLTESANLFYQQRIELQYLSLSSHTALSRSPHGTCSEVEHSILLTGNFALSWMPLQHLDPAGTSRPFLGSSHHGREGCSLGLHGNPQRTRLPRHPIQRFLRQFQRYGTYASVECRYVGLYASGWLAVGVLELFLPAHCPSLHL